MPVGTVGGSVKAHAGARLAQRILGPTVTSASELAMIIGSAGLASNLAALRALCTDGIQRGHMALHGRWAREVESGPIDMGVAGAAAGADKMVHEATKTRGDGAVTSRLSGADRGGGGLT
jgi:hydroxymethylglutaryl-CoA reductase